MSNESDPTINTPSPAVILDHLGAELRVGDVVAYAAGTGRSAGTVRIGWIKNTKQETEWYMGRGYSHQKVLVTRPVKPWPPEAKPPMTSTWQPADGVVLLGWLTKEEVKPQ